MGNLIEEFPICVDCNENTSLDGFRCFNCGMDKNYSEMIDSDLALDWSNN